jgi:hypothetical protein
MTEQKTFTFVTDTATLCIFDLAALRHRFDDDADWWCTPEPELLEVNAGNVAFVGLGDDGLFNVHVGKASGGEARTVSIRCPSGRLFVGAAEEVTGEGLEPDATRGGGFIEVTPGPHRLAIFREGAEIFVSIEPGGDAKNHFAAPIRV